MTANIKIEQVKLTPSIVVTGTNFLISATIIARTFGISNAAGRMIKRAAGEVITTKKEKEG